MQLEDHRTIGIIRVVVYLYVLKTIRMRRNSRKERVEERFENILYPIAPMIINLLVKVLTFL